MAEAAAAAAAAEAEAEVEYHSRDFEWEELRQQVESDPSLQYHLTPFTSSPSPSPPPLPGADAWRRFHRRHSAGKFFKERRYLLKEFPELVSCDNSTKVLEVGCGNGSTVLPILRAKQSIIVYACDCSSEILEKTKQMIAAAYGVSVEKRFHPFMLDLSVNCFPSWLFCKSCQETSLTKPHKLPSRSFAVFYDDKERSFVDLDDSPSVLGAECCIGGIDFVSLIFTLSAVPFQKMPFVIAECFSVQKPGGFLVFRDYGLYDMTMLRFPPEQRVGCREYMRSDGTLSYFFTLDTVRDLFLNAGFIELELEYCCIKSVNRQTGKKMYRVWVHGKFQKPI